MRPSRRRGSAQPRSGPSSSDVATRLYLSNAAAPFTPSTIRGAWTQTSATIGKLGAKAGSAATSQVTGLISSTALMNGRWVSDPFVQAGNLGGTVDFAYGAVESSALGSAGCQVHIYVTQGDTDTPRGTLLANSSVGDTWTTTATGRGAAAVALSTVAAQVGDRIVVEAGAAVSNWSSSRSTTINYGVASGTDLTVGDVNVTTRPGWFEFSGADPLFTAPAASPVPFVSQYNNFH